MRPALPEARREVLLRLAVAAAAGALWGRCHGREGLLLGPWIALVPLLLLLERPRPALSGFVHGLAAWMVAIPWITPTVVTYGQLDGWLGALALLLLAAYLAAFDATFAGLGARLWAAAGWRAAAGVPGLWVALEAARAHLLSGFPWNVAAYALAEVPGALPLSAWVGAYGVSGLLLAVNAAVALAVRRRRWEPAAASVLAALALLAVAGRWAGRGGEDPAAALPVRILQPNLPILTAFDPAPIEAQYARVLDLAGRACDEPGALLIWPESAGWPYSYGRDERLGRDLAALTARGCGVLFNSPVAAAGPAGAPEWRNAALLVDATGLTGRYDKRHLVPFGEYVPGGDWLPFVRQLARNAGAFRPGKAPSTLPWRGERLGAAICFEVIFPGEVADLPAAGASVLVSLTNDAWYGDSAAPRQHLRAARFRAAENRRPLARAALTGISALIGPDGRILQSLEVDREGVIAARLVPGRGRTPYGRAPWLPPGAAAVLAGFAMVLGSRRRGTP